MSLRSWLSKFRAAFHGIALAARGQHSFLVHGGCAALVILAGIVLRVGLVEWCLLVVCITLVLAAEAFNSALESLGRIVDREHNPQLGAALDMASGAVLLCALGASVVGLIIFIHRCGIQLRWWL
jgi:diacylglycerol kinase